MSILGLPLLERYVQMWKLTSMAGEPVAPAEHAAAARLV
jgi:hypothetical protein